MASQRIVITSPWKLGLFVFLLVVGCGFGLIFADFTFFGGSLDFANEKALQTFYIVCGAVSALGLLGYIAVVSSARPLEGVVKGNKRREKLIKRFGQISDVRSVEPSDFAEEPALRDALERWRDDCGAASEAQQAIASQRQAIVQLAQSLQASGTEPGQLLPSGSQPELNALVDSINDLIREMQPRDARPEVAVAPSSRASADAPDWLQAGKRLHIAQQQLLGFAASVGQSSEELQRRSQSSMATGSGPSPAGLQQSGIADALARGMQRLANSREKLEALAEESNRLAIQAALQVSRVGEPAAELLHVTEEIRSLSTRYQRLASELRLSESDQEIMQAEWNKLMNRAGQSATEEGGTGLSPDALRNLVMVLDQNAGGLEELATLLAREAKLLAGDAIPSTPTPTPTPTPQPRPARAVRAASMPEPAKPKPAPAPVVAKSAAPEPTALSAPVVPISGPRVPVQLDTVEDEQIFEMQELGGRELDDSGQPIYDLLEFGAVEL